LTKQDQECLDGCHIIPATVGYNLCRTKASFEAQVNFQIHQKDSFYSSPSLPELTEVVICSEEVLWHEFSFLFTTFASFSSYNPIVIDRWLWFAIPQLDTSLLKL
jgi:hypothetical protein